MKTVLTITKLDDVRITWDDVDNMMAEFVPATEEVAGDEQARSYMKLLQTHIRQRVPAALLVLLPDICRHCGMWFDQHVDGKCLFESTQYAGTERLTEGRIYDLAFPQLEKSYRLCVGR